MPDIGTINVALTAFMSGTYQQNGRCIATREDWRERQREERNAELRASFTDDDGDDPDDPPAPSA